MLTNWAAALKLPFVYLGLAKDFWSEFDDRYLELEKGLRSTFFVIPHKNCAGKNSNGPAPMFRAARYSAADIADTIRKLVIAGSEVGLHGIDAWCDSAQGSTELEEIRRVSGVSTIGVRMHWLYYDQQSPVALEKAGAAYDSTMGYNETVGYRAGTTQVYRPLEATRLLELPLHVMDTALFYPAYLGLSPWQARTVLGRMADDAVQFGGCLTINWHDRSLAPERLWDTSYRDLVQELRKRGAWFATAGDAVSWFQKRRSVVFERDGMGPDIVCVRGSADKGDHLPSLRLRIHNARESCGIEAHDAQGSEGYFDMALDESVNARVPCTASC
jgi:peptidoglycan/xylan/chitin deacetylase (PgdA/CDA1 family)